MNCSWTTEALLHVLEHMLCQTSCLKTTGDIFNKALFKKCNNPRSIFTVLLLVWINLIQNNRRVKGIIYLWCKYSKCETGLSSKVIFGICWINYCEVHRWCINNCNWNPNRENVYILIYSLYCGFVLTAKRQGTWWDYCGINLLWKVSLKWFGKWNV